MLTSSPQDRFATLSPESEQRYRECFIEDPATGRIRFTPKGRAAYRAQFGRAGIDIARIRTRDEFREACRRSEHVFVADLRQMVKGHTELEAILESVWPST
ncbi:MAG: hypothetical protein ACM36C_08960 [Acidobacteriota bacterium]